MLVLFSHSSTALVARAAIRAPTFTVSTYAGDATGFPYVGRDGGGGGSINGKNVIVYSDTTTTNAAGDFVNFSSNSYAFVPNPKDPLQLQDFGSTDKPQVPTEVVPWYGTENVTNNFIWPNSMSERLSQTIEYYVAKPGTRQILLSLNSMIRQRHRPLPSTQSVNVPKMALALVCTTPSSRSLPLAAVCR